MTVSTTDSVIEYVSGGPAYPIPYRFLQNSDIQAVLVKQDGTSETLVLGTQYTLIGAGTQNGGTLTSAYAAGFLATAGATLTISRVMSPVQPTDLRNQGRFLAETHETVFDRLTMLIQQGFAIIGRALLRPIGKNYYDAQGRQIKNVGDPTDAQDATTRSWVMTQVNSARTDLTKLAYALYNQSIAYAESLVAGVVGGYGSFLQAGLGAIARTFQGKMRDVVSVKDFGAVGDGITNDTAAFQACFSAFPSGDIKVPAGIYILTGTLTKESGVISGDGRASILVFDNMNGADGIVFNPQGQQTLSGAVNLTVLARGNNGGRAFVAPQDFVQYATRRSAYVFDTLYIAGYTLPAAGTQNAFETIETWLCGIETGDGIGCDIDNYQFYGSYRSDTDPALQVQSCGIRLRAAFTLLTAQLTKLTICNAYRGIEIGKSAFWQINKFDISHTYDGVFQIEAGAFNECILSDGNINSQHVGIYFFSIGGRRIKNIIVRRHRFGWKGATYDWYGLRLESCNSTWISKYEAEPSEVDGAFLGTQYNMSLVTCGGTMIDNVLVGGTCDRGILLDNCAQTVINNVESFQNEASAILFRFINNTRNAHIGNYAVVSSFIGTVMSKDAATLSNPIQMMNQAFDFQTSGSATMSMTRSNAAADQRIWSFALGTNSFNRQAVNDSGSGTNFELVTRTGNTIDEIQWRATQLRIGNAGPVIRGGSGSPEGVITAPPGSLWLNTTSGGGNYQKLTGTGNTGWTAI